MRLYVILLISPMPLRESKAESTFGKVAGIFHADLYPFVLEWCNAIHPDPIPFIYHSNHLLYNSYNSSKRFQRFNHQLVCVLLQVQQSAATAKYAGPVDCAKQLYREGGIRSIYGGTMATFLRGHF